VSEFDCGHGPLMIYDMEQMLWACRLQSAKHSLCYSVMLLTNF